MARFDLRDEEWAMIEPSLPGAEGKRSRGRPTKNDRQVFNGIFYVMRTGIPWRDLPERYGPYTTVYNCFNRWVKVGVWGRLFEALAQAAPNSLQMIDSSVVRADQHAAGAKNGGDEDLRRSRGGLSSKLHALIESRGLSLKLALIARQVADCLGAPELLPAAWDAACIMADKAYDANWLLAMIEETGATANIPPKANRRQSRPLDAELYKQRNLVERFFNKIKHFRRIATRYEKCARNYLAKLSLAATRIWLRHFESTA